MARLDTLLAARPEWWGLIASWILEYGDIAVSCHADALIQDKNRRCAGVLLRIMDDPGLSAVETGGLGQASQCA